MRIKLVPNYRNSETQCQGLLSLLSSATGNEVTEQEKTICLFETKKQ